jgi:hypothetical protein
MKRQTSKFLVRDLRRLLEGLPANQEVFVDIPEEDTLRRFVGTNYFTTDEDDEPIIVLDIEP